MTSDGLPEALPNGESILWSGSPDRSVLAREVLHVRKLVAYFALLALWAAYAERAEGLAAAVPLAAKMIAIGAVPVALAYFYARAVAAGAVYTITDRRVVLRIGVALPMTLNLPFSRIASADLRESADGSGDLSLTLSPGGQSFPYVVLWPHARPWRFLPARPTLRALRDARAPAQVLARALAGTAAVATPGRPREVGPVPAGAAA